jgi:hypothetical protein
MRLARASLVGVAAALAALTMPAATARADTLPSGMIGPVVGVRDALGAVADQFGFGALWGVEAGWQPMSPNRRVGIAVRWRTLFSGYWSHEPSSVADNLRVIEMDAGLYARIALGETRASFFNLGAGWSLLRANVPLPPKDRRSYTGPYAGLGLETFVSGSTSITFEMRAGELALGPLTISAIFGVKQGL